MMKKIKTRITALLCAVALVVSLCPVVRAETDTAPYLEVESVNTYSGGRCTIWINGFNFEAMALLELEIRYDESVLSVENTRTDGMDIASVNTSQSGVIKYSGISENGVSEDTQLLSITFTVAENAAAGDYKVSVLVKEAMAYVNDVETDVALMTKPGTVTVERWWGQDDSLNFYFSYSSSEFMPGEIVAVTIFTWQQNDLAAGQFEFTYDSDKFEYIGLELLASMKTDSYIHTVNAATTGVVRMMYASDTAVENGSLMRLKLKVKENASGQTDIRFTPSGLLDENENSLSASSSSIWINIISPVNNDAAVWVEMPDRLVKDEVFTASFWVAGDSGLAAGDFSIFYDRELVECVGVTSALASDDESLSDAGIVIISDEYSNGEISFSYLNSDGIAESTCLITAQFRAVGQAFHEIVLRPVCITTPVDKNISPIELECADAVSVILGTRIGTLDENLTWTLTEDGTLTISGEGNMEIYDWCGAPWYECRKYISSVVICDGVTSIGYAAFMDCTEMESVVLPNNLYYINSCVFWNCSSLKEIVLPDGLREINYSMFYKCESLESVTIPASIARICGDAFYNCEMLSEVIFEGGPLQWKYMDIEDNNDVLYRDIVTCTGTDKMSGECGEKVTWSLGTDGVLTISGNGYMNYLGCQNAPWYIYRDLIIAAVIEDGVTNIGGEAFCGCRALESVVIGKSVTSIDSYAFEFCTSLTNIYIPSHVNQLGSAAFYYCTALESVVIPEGVTDLYWGLFESCRSLIRISIPASVDRVEDGVFRNCESLDRVIVLGGSKQWESMYIGEENDPLYNAEIVFGPIGDDHVHTADWTYNYNYHWRECESCGEQVDYVEHVWTLTDEKDPNCQSAGYAKYSCECGAGRTEVFEKLKCSLETIPGQDPTCTEWGYSTHEKCTSCGTIYHFEDFEPLGHDYDKGTVTKEPTTTEVGEKVYTCRRAGCGDSKSEELPMLDAVARGTCGENLAWALTEDGVLTIRGTGEMFDVEVAPWSEYAAQITKVVIEDGVTSIGDNAFADCGNLQEVEIPATVTGIGDHVFSGCESLTVVTYAGSQEQWDEVEIGEGNEVMDGKVEVTAVKKGDVNGDGTVNGRDTIIIATAIANRTTQDMTSEQFKAADVNGDGNVNGRDTIIIATAIANRTTDEL